MSPSRLTYDGQPEARQVECAMCGTSFVQSLGFVLADGTTHAVYYAGLHHHDGLHDAWLDVIMGSWPERDGDPYPLDHVTFSCRVGPGSAAPDPYASLIQAPASARGDNEGLFGRMLSREEALGHPWLPEFWRVVDFAVIEDQRVRDHLDHQPGSDETADPGKATP
jgi:hypothetical protein